MKWSLLFRAVERWNIPRLSRNWNDKSRFIWRKSANRIFSPFNNKAILPLARLALSSRWGRYTFWEQEENESRLAVLCLSFGLLDHGYLFLTNVVHYGRYILGGSIQLPDLPLFVFGPSMLWVFENSCVVEGRWTQKIPTKLSTDTGWRLQFMKSDLIGFAPQHLHWGHWGVEGHVMAYLPRWPWTLFCLSKPFFLPLNIPACHITRASEELSIVEKPVPIFEADIIHWLAIQHACGRLPILSCRFFPYSCLVGKNLWIK